MVDLQEPNQPAHRKQSDGKVKSLMDRTPSFLKSKFLSVLDTSNDLINGITTKVMNSTPNPSFFSIEGN